MAATSEKHVYRGEDLVDEYLLNQVSKWILFHRLGTLPETWGSHRLSSAGLRHL